MASLQCKPPIASLQCKLPIASLQCKPPIASRIHMRIQETNLIGC